MQTITLKENYKREILEEQLAEQDISQLLNYLDRIDNLIGDIDVPEIDQKIDDAREFLSQVEAGQKQAGVFDFRKKRETRKQMQVVQNATVQVANLLKNMKKIVTLSAKNLLPRLKKTGFDPNESVEEVLGKIPGPRGPGAVPQRMEMLIKASLNPKWLKGEPAIDATAAASQIMALPFRDFMKFVQKSSAGNWKIPQSKGQGKDEKGLELDTVTHNKILKSLGLDPGDEGQAQLAKLIAVIKKNKVISKGFVTVLDALKGGLGKDFDPKDLQAVYNALKG